MTRGLLTDDVTESSLIVRVLELARNQLLLDVAWLAQLDEADQLVVRAVTGDGSAFGIDVGWSSSGGAGAVAELADGAVGSDRVVASLSGVGAHVGAAVLLADGQPYGVLCCAG